MWEFKKFKTFAQQKAWIEKNDYRYQITIIYINNGYGVEYKKLRRIG
jgi:hypothetical protein